MSETAAKTIVVVDDEPDIVMVLAKRLEAAGYRVLTAGDGLIGVELVIRARPDLVVMDVLMPRLSGGEAVKRLRENNATHQTPVIFLTGIAARKDVGEQEMSRINVGGESYPALSKPIDSARLLQLIRSLIK